MVLHVVMFVRRLRNPPAPSSGVRVIAVGNLSVGGTGKSVFVEWLVKNACLPNPAILMRGYKSPILRKKMSFVVSDGWRIYGVDFVGDEPLQAAEKTRVPVAIGKHRSKTLEFLEAQLGNQIIKTVILDDGYQTQTIHKDCAVLLVDARSPLGNGYLLPAGPLREKDYSRVDIIIFTHVDQVETSIEKLCQRNFPLFDKKRIFGGRHAVQDLQRVSGLGKHFLRHDKRPCVLISGIAQPKNLEISVRDLEIDFLAHYAFQDHHSYVYGSVEKMLQEIVARGVAWVITTEKDWTKLRTMRVLFEKMLVDVYVLSVRFEFLPTSSYDTFISLIHEILAKNDRKRV